MVTKYGMSDRLGARTFGDQNSEPFIGLEYGHSVDYSQETAAIIDEEIHSIIDSSYKRCTEILAENMDKLKEVAELLLEKEKIEGDEFDALFEEKPQNVSTDAENETTTNEASADSIGNDDI